MTTPKIAILNAETGEVEIRDFTVEELAQIEADKEIINSEAEAEAAKAAEKAALLAKLGITEDEAKLLLS
jgi:hypothetical protein